jgi:outer membrane protein OmpA-like peptidoglycan-associated protein
LAGLGTVWMRRRRKLAAALAAAPLALAATHAHADGFAQDGFTAPAAPADLMWTERAGSDAGHLRPFGRLTLGFADDPLVLVDQNDSSRQVRVVDDQFALYGAFGFGFFHRAHLALLMPLYVQSSSFQEAAGSVKGTKPGDLGVDGRFTILDRHAPLELALAATLRLPTGDRESYASDGKVTVWPRALLSKQLSDAGTLINLSAGPVIRPKNQEVGVTTGTQFRFTAGVLLALTKVVGVTGEIAGSATTVSPSKRNTPLEGALGGRLDFGSFVLGSTIGTGLTEGVGAPDWRWLAMIAVPGPFEQEPQRPPEAPAIDDDSDHDGVRGAADQCPTEAEDKDGHLDEDGCPEADNDKDGIPDSKDKCPTEPEDKDGFEDEDGCPDLDNDKDGIADSKDKCPTEAEDLDQWMDEDGCPDADNDNDGVPDADDKCPNEPETKNGIDDADGCPDLLRVESGMIRTLEPIYFDYNKATIQARSEPLLLEMANLIRTRPDLGAIVIEGHTDNKGAAKYNLKLSKDRAASVRAFLITAGVSEARLSSEGFGSERPIADNKTDAGRAQNRRVEFHFAAPAAAPPPVKP